MGPKSPAGNGVKRVPWGRGVQQIRCIAPRRYGIWVDKELVPRLKEVKGFTQGGLGSNLFYLSLPLQDEDSDEGAYKTFFEMVRQNKDIAAYLGA